jgi:hypothetical protein
MGRGRVAFAVLALALAGAAAFAFLQAGKVDDLLVARDATVRRARREAVASRLTTEDVDGPMGEPAPRRSPRSSTAGCSTPASRSRSGTPTRVVVLRGRPDPDRHPGPSPPQPDLARVSRTGRRPRPRTVRSTPSSPSWWAKGTGRPSWRRSSVPTRHRPPNALDLRLDRRWLPRVPCTGSRHPHHPAVRAIDPAGSAAWKSCAGSARTCCRCTRRSSGRGRRRRT